MLLDDPDAMEFFEPILRADFQAFETYCYEQSDPLDIPIWVAIGTDEEATYEKAIAWQFETKREVEVVQFPGNHFFIFEHEREIVEIIANKLGL
jgi:surfactin synthase thioesterase subunit